MPFEKITCLECGKQFKRIDFHIKSHGLNSNEYREKYGKNTPLICDKILQDMREKYISPRSVKFYTNKGLSEVEAKKELLRLSKENSPFCVEFYMKKGYTKQDAKNKILELNNNIEYNPEKNKNRPEYWIKKGLSKNDALLKVKELQSKNHEKFLENMYKQGLSNKEALKIKAKKQRDTELKNLKEKHGDNYMEKYKERRNLTSLESFQKRHGVNKGLEKYKEFRSNNPTIFQKEYWINKGYSEKEAQKIISNNNKRDKNFFIRKYGEVQGNLKYNEFLRKTRTQNTYSKAACDLFSKLANMFKDLNFRFAEQEVKLENNNKSYFLDCVIDNGFKQIVIEFNGDYWHANPNIYNKDDIINGQTAEKIWEYDLKKSEAILENFDGFMVVWESDVIFENIINFIKGEFYESQY